MTLVHVVNMHGIRLGAMYDIMSAACTTMSTHSVLKCVNVNYIKRTTLCTCKVAACTAWLAQFLLHAYRHIIMNLPVKMCTLVFAFLLL